MPAKNVMSRTENGGKGRPPIAVVLVLLALSAVPGVRAQNEEKRGRLSLGADKGAKGDDVYIPVVFSPAAGTQTRAITAEIEFPGRTLEFVEIRSSGSADSANLDLKADTLSGGGSSERGSVRIQVTTKSSEGIQSGVVAQLTFKVVAAPATGPTVALKATGEAVALKGLEKSSLVTNDGEIEIVGVPTLFACFFYMH